MNVSKSFEFTKTTVIGGFLAVFPVALIALLVAKMVAGIRGVIHPLVVHLPTGPSGGHIIATLVAITLVFVACFVAGAAIRTALGERVWRVFEQRQHAVR